MQIDFTKMDNMGQEARLKQAVEEFSEKGNPPAPFSPPFSAPAQPPDLGADVRLLQRKADRAEEERERARQVYREYQANIMASGTLRSEVLKGAANGTDLCSLLLTAAECISRMTGDGGVFAKSLKNRLHERGLRTLEPLPLADRKKDAETRLERLREAQKRAQDKREAEFIGDAIREHEAELRALGAMLGL